MKFYDWMNKWVLGVERVGTQPPPPPVPAIQPTRWQDDPVFLKAMEDEPWIGNMGHDQALSFLDGMNYRFIKTQVLLGWGGTHRLYHRNKERVRNLCIAAGVAFEISEYEDNKDSCFGSYLKLTLAIHDPTKR